MRMHTIPIALVLLLLGASTGRSGPKDTPDDVKSLSLEILREPLANYLSGRHVKPDVVTTYSPSRPNIVKATAIMKNGSKADTLFDGKRLAGVIHYVDITCPIGKYKLIGGSACIPAFIITDPVATIGSNAVITMTLKAHPDVKVTVTLTPDYGDAMLDFMGGIGIFGADATVTEHGQAGGKGGDALNCEVRLGYAPDGKLVVAVAKKVGAQDSTPVLVPEHGSGELDVNNLSTVFDPAKAKKVTILAVGGTGGQGGGPGEHKESWGGRGGPGGKGGKITILYDAAHPELKDMVVVDNSGGPGGPGQGSASEGSTGAAGPKPEYKAVDGASGAPGGDQPTPAGDSGPTGGNGIDFGPVPAGWSLDAKLTHGNEKHYDLEPIAGEYDKPHVRVCRKVYIPGAKPMTWEKLSGEWKSVFMRTNAKTGVTDAQLSESDFAATGGLKGKSCEITGFMPHGKPTPVTRVGVWIDDHTGCYWALLEGGPKTVDKYRDAFMTFAKGAK